MIENDFKHEVARYMRRLYKKGLTTITGGNVSYRQDNKIYITATKVEKGNIKANQIAEVTINGENLSPEINISMETAMHLKIYQNRPDANSIIHAHPPFITAFSCSDKELDTTITGESFYVCGRVARSGYALMGTNQLAILAAEASLKSNVILLDNHGIIAIGRSLLEAYDRIEVLENTAKINLLTKFIGDRNVLPNSDLKIISAMF